MRLKSMRLLISGAAVLLCILFILSLITGVAELTPDILLLSRLPRTLTIILAGAGISVCGLIMQKISRNPFVSPETAGSADSAALGYIFALLVAPRASVVLRLSVSFTVALAGSLLFFLLISRFQKRSILYVPLVGLILGRIVGGITQILAYRFDIIQVLGSWLFADFSLIIAGRYEFVFLILPAVAGAYLLARHITIAGLGKDIALSLGSDYFRTVLLSLTIVSFVTSLVVVTAGRVPFLGIVIPNMISLMIGDNVKSVLPLTALSGSILLLVSDIFGRIIIAPFEIPVGLTMGIVGSIAFLLLLKQRKSHA